MIHAGSCLDCFADPNLPRSAGTDPSPRFLAALLKVVRAKGVKVLFTEPASNPRLAKRLADDLGIAVAELDVLETGALTPTSYEEGMRRNLAVLRQALK